MLSVNINRDVEQYQESVVLGLNATQTIAGIITLVAGIGVTCLLHIGCGMAVEESAYISVPFCVLTILPVLKTKDGISMTERLKKSRQRKQILLYHTTDLEALTEKRGVAVTQNTKKQRNWRKWCSEKFKTKG